MKQKWQLWSSGVRKGGPVPQILFRENVKEDNYLYYMLVRVIANILKFPSNHETIDIEGQGHPINMDFV